MRTLVMLFMSATRDAGVIKSLWGRSRDSPCTHVVKEDDGLLSGPPYDRRPQRPSIIYWRKIVSLANPENVKSVHFPDSARIPLR